MPLIPKLIPNNAVLQRIATLPLTTYQAGETVFAAGTKSGRLLILRKGAQDFERRLMLFGVHVGVLFLRARWRQGCGDAHGCGARGLLYPRAAGNACRPNGGIAL